MQIFTPTPDQVADILRKHKLWLAGQSEGERANLNGANLERANLERANLERANLNGANLKDANLKHANLKRANLNGANLKDANLERANLERANLKDANLKHANLKDLLNGALVLARTEILPREGEIVGWKKCRRGVLVKLRIPADAARSNAPGERKCRAERAETLEIVPCDGETEARSIHNYDFVYEVGQTAAADRWGTDRFTVCAPGIHFFLTREEAEAYE